MGDRTAGCNAARFEIPRVARDTCRHKSRQSGLTMDLRGFTQISFYPCLIPRLSALSFSFLCRNALESSRQGEPPLNLHRFRLLKIFTLALLVLSAAGTVGFHYIEHWG